jgi:hypothetical protein
VVADITSGVVKIENSETTLQHHEFYTRIDTLKSCPDMSYNLYDEFWRPVGI